MSKIVGILGGMGPLATVDLFAKIVQSTPAARDQDHLRIIIDNNPQIPPRVEAILNGAESPLGKMVESGRLLERAGAELIVMPCNTAHYWLTELQQAVGVPVVDMIACAAAYISRQSVGSRESTLLLATAATISTRLYQNAFAAAGLKIRIPNAAEQAAIDASVRQVKAGKVAENSYLDEISAMFARYAADGTQSVLAGCTEVPLLFPYLDDSLSKYDATAILARTVVELALGD